MNAFRMRHLENCLHQFEKAAVVKQPLDIYLKSYFSKHGNVQGADRAWITENAYELMRWQGLLDYVAPPPQNWSTRLRTFFISDRWRAHSLNERLPAHIRCSFPETLFRRIESALGTAKALNVCNTMNEKPTTFLRVNAMKTRRDKVFKYLLGKGLPVEKCAHSPVGIQLGGTHRLRDLPEFQQGYFEMQDESSQLIGFKVEAKAGDVVMDFCGGSGGKTLVFAPLMENRGRVYVHDPRDSLLMQARQRLRRAGIENYHLLPPRHPSHLRIRGKCDWVLVDVPCTATATLRRNPERKWDFSDDKLFEYVHLQREIFEKALAYLKPGGKIVFSTASVLDEENVQQTKYFCEKHGLYLSEAPFHSLPQSRGMEGFFCAVFERQS
uniref:SAM-dependent MTase RsmB/NOP-type domain-containing protein n=1 Tax=Chromera velia CCMP2878 TaxID=1169474 RepID=A0A0G4GZC8_9ALVE|eukprot:Cvel_5446.t1-p1 / transcript=Cvel_5446.t1 / gene=Cvel_5446 / organism=Chromera_velia_CCMP2878 / gene_product=Ribosomal RNA small subunit methyltransferase B, putative / transcript_product=Ribosomal RNA small subunit methyltransferase B, putative / location=Cvel_scaffold254:62228-67074(+) / protein_length=381 / sequence_SO=supercontig / SO=protein_coding / is_pseudo=false